MYSEAMARNNDQGPTENVIRGSGGVGVMLCGQKWVEDRGGGGGEGGGEG